MASMRPHIDGFPITEECKRYILEDLDPVVQDMVADVMDDLPENLHDYLVTWLRRRKVAPAPAPAPPPPSPVKPPSGVRLSKPFQASEALRLEWLVRVVEDPDDLAGAPKEVRADRDIVLAAVQEFGSALEHASINLKQDKEIVLAAVSTGGDALEYASAGLAADRDIVLAAASNFGAALEFASAELRRDREVALAACSNDGEVLRLLDRELQADREVVLVAVRQNGLALRHAAGDMRADREVVVAAVLQSPEALDFTSADLVADREVMLAAVTKDGRLLERAPEGLKADREMLLAAYRGMGLELSDGLKTSQDVVVAAASKDGSMLQYAADTLRSDDGVVREIIQESPRALTWAKGGLSRNRRMTALVGMSEGVCSVLSVKVPAAGRPPCSMSPFSTLVCDKVIEHGMLGPFNAYNPNAVRRAFCGPEDRLMDAAWPCRGQCGVFCAMAADSTCDLRPPCAEASEPSSHCCWRRAFRWHIERAQRLGGFMIQVVERPTVHHYHSCDEWDGDLTLSEGQQVEAEMAREVGLTIFRLEMPNEWDTLSESKVDPLVADLAMEVVTWQHHS